MVRKHESIEKSETGRRRNPSPSASRARATTSSPAGKSAARKSAGKSAAGKSATGRASRGDAKAVSRSKRGKKKTATAIAEPIRTRDKHVLYQISVQAPDFEVALLQRIFRQIRKRPATRLREDFCGTALLASEWVKRIPEGRALGIDLDRPTLDWGREHNLAPLGPRAERVELLEQDVLDPPKSWPADIAVAFNFSYFVFKERSTLLRYFRQVRETIAEDGVFCLDLYGGPEAQVEQEEPREIDEGFTYVWDQASYNPITGDTTCHIHFDFPDGSRMRRAFTYEWRLWSLPELRDVLLEAGFERVDAYWEGTDRKTGEGNSVFRPSVKGDDSSGWVTYVVAVK